MESWKQGRGELFDHLKNVYDQIGESIASELNNDKYTRISTEDLRILRETSANVQRIAESHGRMTDELEVCRAAVKKVEELERENKRLAQELQKKLKEESTPTPISKPTSRVQDAIRRDRTPGSSEPPSSIALIEPGETKQVMQKKYEELVKKYNKTCQKFDAMKGAKEQAETLAKEAGDKCQAWKDWGNGMEEKVEKRDEKIRKLKEDIIALKSKIAGQSDTAAAQSISIPQTVNVEVSPSLKPIASEVKVAEVQVPASSPPKVARPKVLDEAFASTHSRVLEPHDHLDETQMELPVLPDEDHVGDTSFEPLEAHHTSSTEGDPDPVLPQSSARGEAETEPRIEHEKHSSPAVFISSRSVKKRSSRGQNTDETPGPKVKIEVVELSSPHTPVLGNYVNVAESMDLDDIGEKVSTPRKAPNVNLVSQHMSRPMANSQNSSQSCSHSQAQGDTSTATVHTPVRSEKSVLQPRSVNAKILPRTSDDSGRASKKRKVAIDRAVSDVTEDGEANPTSEDLQRQKIIKDDRLIDLLSKPSPNRQVLSPPKSRSTVRPSTSILSALQESASKRSSASTSALAHELLGITPRKQMQLAKSSIETHKPSREISPISRPSLNRASREPAETTALKQATTSLLEASRPISGQVPGSSAESFKPSSGLSSTSSKARSIPDEGVSSRGESPVPGTQLPARRDLASAFISRTTTEVAKSSPRTPTLSRPSRPVASKKKLIQTEAEYEMDPDQEPVRARPLSKLSLSDFKVNKAYNNGTDYAYNEVLRGKEARACVEGCVRPCCGPKFRVLAKSELDIRPSTLSQEGRDDSLLRDYLGIDADRIKNMSVAEREEILIQAKTREIANKTGKHRQAYVRGASPTGFWRTDFATTQEEKEDREKERENDRLEVEHRWREAMRGGGAYIFRDE
ncbi:hypothetical protein WAI453_000028 [Rhynchosporium graminicola]